MGQEAVAPVAAAEPPLEEPPPEEPPPETPVPQPEPVPEIPPKEAVVQPLPNPTPRPLRLPRSRPVKPLEDVEAKVAQARTTLAEDKKKEEAAVEKRYLATAVRAIHLRLSYPKDARARGLTGRPSVGFRVEPSGRVLANSISLKVSSGHDILDKSALAAVAEATLGPPPPSLANKEIILTLKYNRERSVR
jgi:protein TonB